MIEKTRGVVLHVTKYDDRSRIVDIYTESRGNVSFWVKTPVSRKAASRGVRYMPLAMLELDFDYRPSAGLQRVRDARYDYTYMSLPYHPLKSAVGLFLVEFLYKVLKNEVANAPLFAYLTTSLQWFDRSQRGFANFHLVFITRLTRFLGFYPNVEDYCEGDFFDMLNACFVHERPLNAACLGPDEAARIPLFMRMNYDSMRFFAMNRQERMRYVEVLNDYYRLHIPDFPELKSLDVLKEVFD